MEGDYFSAVSLGKFVYFVQFSFSGDGRDMQTDRASRRVRLGEFGVSLHALCTGVRGDDVEPRPMVLDAVRS